MFTPDWLEKISSFAFQSRQGVAYTVRKQAAQRGGTYWYAYRRRHGRIVKRYLGKTADLSIARLEDMVRLEEALPPAFSLSAASPSPETLLLLSKLAPPRLPALLVERPTLLARLATGFSHALTLLQAPAGFGKTTAAAQWIAERRAYPPFPPVAWLSLDAGDNDPIRFWRSLIMAFQTLQPHLGQAALAQLAQAMDPPFQMPPLETVVTHFLNDLARHIPDGMLVLDDYQAIEAARIHGTLAFFIEHLPGTLHVLLLSRAEPPLPLLRWRARGMLYELHGADLRFTAEETAKLLRQTLSISLSDAALGQLDASLEGWPAGLRLLSLTLKRKQTAQEVEQALLSMSDGSGRQARQPLLDYFVTEILEAQPEPLQRFLLQTSVLSRLSSPLCNAITGAKNGATQLEAIERAGLFLEALDGSRIMYRYHAFFAEALRHEAALRLGEEALRALSLRASHWYEQHRMATEAIEAALLAYDFERTAVLIEQVDADGQLSELHTAHRWLAPMPEAVLRAHPMLCWLAALSTQIVQEEASSATAENPKVQVLLHMAEEGWQQQGKPAFLGLIPAFYALASWRAASSPRTLEAAQQALAMLPSDDQNRRIQMTRGICVFIVGAAHMYAGRFGEARPLLLEARALSLVNGDRHFIRGLLLLVGVCCYALGELHQAHEYYQQVFFDAQRQEDSEVTAEALLGLASTAWEWNEMATVEGQTREALALAQKENTSLRDRAAFQLARVCHARGQITAAEQQLGVLLARLEVNPTPQAAWLLPDVLTLLARLSLEAGDLQSAARRIEVLEPKAQMKASVLQARLLLSQGQPREALLQLEPLLSVAEDWRSALEARVLLALAYAACQESQQAHQHLQQALAQARGRGPCPAFSFRRRTAGSSATTAFAIAARTSVAFLRAEHPACLPVSRWSIHSHSFLGK